MSRKYIQNRLKTAWSRLRYFISLLKIRFFGKTNPVICVLVLTNKCNLNCRYCFGGYAARKIPDYTTEELKKLIDELYKMGTRYLNIHGGEALLRKDIGEIVDCIKIKGIYCCLITNGTLLSKDKLDEIRNVDNITISLDGRRENNDKNRGEGNYDKALEAIKLIIKEKIPLRVHATLTRYTMNDIGYLANLAKEFNFSLYFSILFKPLPKARDMEMTDREIHDVTAEIIKYKKMGYPIFTSYRVLGYAMSWPLDHNGFHFIRGPDKWRLPKGFKPIKCYYGRNKFTIEADGNVYPCFLLTDSFKPLNWREVGIKKAIEHVRKTNDCIACPSFTQNDHNLLLGLDIKQIGMVILEQVKEAFKRR